MSKKRIGPFAVSLMLLMLCACTVHAQESQARPRPGSNPSPHYVNSLPPDPEGAEIVDRALTLREAAGVRLYVYAVLYNDAHGPVMAVHLAEYKNECKWEQAAVWHMNQTDERFKRIENPAVIVSRTWSHSEDAGDKPLGLIAFEAEDFIGIGYPPTTPDVYTLVLDLDARTHEIDKAHVRAY